MDFNIVNHSGNVDTCAQFFYNGKQISMSTIGRSKGACATPVAVFDGVDFQHHVGDFIPFKTQLILLMVTLM